MDPVMTKEESYAERRELFKNIWDTAMHIDAKEPDIVNKQKVIKTLRLDEVDRCAIGKTKKQRIKNLRTVCNKILDFCDRQDADDKFYEQMTAEGVIPLHDQIEDKPKKKRPVRTRKMVKRVKSMVTPLNNLNEAQTIVSKQQDVLSAQAEKTSRNTSPIKIKKTSLAKNLFVNKVVKEKQNKKLRTSVPNYPIVEGIEMAMARKIKKKLNNRRNITQPIYPPGRLELPFQSKQG